MLYKYILTYIITCVNIKPYLMCSFIQKLLKQFNINNNY